MKRERENVIAKINQIFQVLVTAGVFLMVCMQVSLLDNANYSKECLFLVILIIPFWFILIEYSKLDIVFHISYPVLFVKYLKIILVGSGVMYLVSMLLGLETFDLHFWGDFFLIDLFALFIFTISSYELLRLISRKDYYPRQVLVLADEEATDFINKFITTKDWGYQIWGIVSPPVAIAEAMQDELKLFSEDDDLREILDKGVIDEVLYCKGKIIEDEVDELVHLCSEVGIVLRLKSAVNSSYSSMLKFSLFNDEPFFVFRNIPGNYLALKLKRLFDLLFSFVVLIVFFPVYFLIALAIKIDDGGPVFFGQQRIGLNGRRFNCLKFRTMVVNAEALRQDLMNQNEQSGPVFKIKMDPRVTRVGRFLRKTSLDELPQFLNVFSGEMSVVGPRPPIPAEVEQYKRWQNRRLSMKPGITCIWQVSGRNKIPFEEWVRMDMQYIDNWSLKQDFIIILKTVKVMITGDGQ